jgi:hypothetical protein
MRKLASFLKVAEGIVYDPAKHDLSRQWFTDRGYTDEEYDKYKSWGYSLSPVEREIELSNKLNMLRKVNAMRAYAGQTGQNSNNMTATFRRGRMTQFTGNPVSQPATAQSTSVSPRTVPRQP